MRIGMTGQMAGGKLSAKSYVQDGLVAMWDGIENAGWGTHDNQSRLVDLTGNHSNIVLSSGIQIDNNSFYNDSSSMIISYANWLEKFNSDIVENGGNFCLEYVEYQTYKSLSLAASLILFNTVGQYIATRHDSDSPFAAGYGLLAGNFYGLYDAICTYSRSRQSSVNTIYRNGAVLVTKTQSVTPSLWTNKNFGIGTVGHIYCVRIYNRALTAAEIAANYTIDQKRFNLT